LKATASADASNPDFVIRHLEDSGQFLAGYAGVLAGTGPESAYSWDRSDAVMSRTTGGVDYAVAPHSHPSAWIGVNETVANDPASIVAGFGYGNGPSQPGDGSAALEIARLRTKDVMVGAQRSFDDYFSEAVARIGLKGESAERAVKTQDAIMADLKTLRETISGVNVDEELAEIIK